MFMMKKNKTITNPKKAKSKTGQLLSTMLYIITFALIIYFFISIPDWKLF